MKNSIKSAIPNEITTTIKTLEKANFQAYLVGGSVRDLLMGKTPKDWDITTNAKPEQIQGLFPKTVYENTFGTVVVINESAKDETLKNIEITPYRLESSYSDYRHPDQVKFSDKLEDDLKRRDFTINAIAMSFSNGAIKDIIDLYGGFRDIKDKTIRSVGEASYRFKEDALRMIRAIRLSVELNFNIEKKTFDAMKQNSELIREISLERIRDEFIKIIMSTDPKRGLELMRDANLLFHVTPELDKTVGISQNQAHKYDVWEHLLRSLQCAADKNFSLEIRLAALFHDISKPKNKGFSRETGQITFYGHEISGSRETYKILERMKFSREMIQKVTKLVRWHMFFSDTQIISHSAVRRMIVNVGKDGIWDLMNLRICDRVGTGRPKENPYRLRKYKAMIEETLKDPVSLAMLKIGGDRIMKICNIKPGHKVGYILHALFSEVLNDPKLNTYEYLEKKAKELAFMSDEELKKLGETGKEKKYEEQEKSVKEIRSKYFVE